MCEKGEGEGAPKVEGGDIDVFEKSFYTYTEDFWETNRNEAGAELNQNTKYTSI